MSYNLSVYMIDLEALRKTIGSKDEALLSAEMKREPESFSEKAAAEEEEIPMGRALRHLLWNEPPDASSAHQYGYALQRLCELQGERLPTDTWESIRWDVIEMSGMEEILTQTGPPVPLPPSDDFPRIGHLKADQIAALVAKMGDGPLTTAAPSGRKPRRSLGSYLMTALIRAIFRLPSRGSLTTEDLAEQLEEYEAWLREAASKHRSLVFFYF